MSSKRRQRRQSCDGKRRHETQAAAVQHLKSLQRKAGLTISTYREGAESYHKLGRKFFAHHGLNRDALIAELNARFQAEKERAA